MVREVILRNLPRASEDIAQKKKWVIDRQAHRLPVWWAIYIFGFDFDFNVDIGAYSQVLTKFVVIPWYKPFYGNMWSSFQSLTFAVQRSMGSCTRCCGDVSTYTPTAELLAHCYMYRVLHGISPVNSTPLLSATQGASDIHSECWGGMGHGSRAL